MTAAAAVAADLADELRHIQNLVFIRELLGARGAPLGELRECDAVIEAARTRLADAAPLDAGRYAPAA